MYELIERYLNRLMKESTPEKPFWNIELKRANKQNRWNYIDGCITSSLLALHQVTNDDRYFNFVESFVDYYIFDDGTIRGYDPYEFSTDDLSESKVLFYLYQQTRKAKYLKAIHHTYLQVEHHPRISTGNFWHKKIYHDQVWLDGLYMMQPFYTMYETQFNFKKNYTDIINQFHHVRKLMFNEEKKLYYHAYNESRSLFWADSKTGLSKNFWLRATGWFVAALADVASLIDDQNYKQELSLLLKEAIDGLLQYQDSNSHLFYQLIDRSDLDKNYLETSGSLLIAYSILKAVNEEILPASYYQTGKNIFDSIYHNRLSEIDGELNLTGICLVAGLGPENNPRRDGTVEYYLSEPIVENDAKGVGPLIMAYTEIIRHEKRANSI